MQGGTWEKYDLVLLWNNRLITARSGGVVTGIHRIMEPQFSTIELYGFAMEEVDERDASRGNHLLRIIAMRPEEISVVAGRNLHLGSRDWEFLNPELLKHSWQNRPNPLQYQFFLNPEVAKNPRASMVVVSDARDTRR
jgi:hypothetical protein